jgi:putative transposase
LLRNEYLVTENRMLRNPITGRVRLTDAERKTLAEIGHKLGKQALAEVATIVKPDTLLGWHWQTGGSSGRRQEQRVCGPQPGQ